MRIEDKNAMGFIKSNFKNTNSSKEPNDGSFIEKDPNDTFSAEGTVRYGEEQDADDL